MGQPRIGELFRSDVLPGANSHRRPPPLAPGLNMIEVPRLTPESVLADLPSHAFQVERDIPGQYVATEFEKRPELPGVVVMDRGRKLGMISRERFLEHLSRPYGLELYMGRPIEALLDACQGDHLEL